MTPPVANSSAEPAAGTASADPIAAAAHLRTVTEKHIRKQRFDAAARRDPLVRELLAQVSAGEQAAADLVTAKATIASLEARVLELEAQVSGKKKPAAPSA